MSCFVISLEPSDNLNLDLVLNSVFCAGYTVVHTRDNSINVVFNANKIYIF